jgi:hydrogenase-4 membrane subunit HyfE
MMGGTLNLLIGLAMGLNLLALGSSRLPSLIRAMSVQGMVLGVMPLLLEHGTFDWRVVLVALATMLGKGLVIPALLRRAMRAANVEREMSPFIGYVPSLLLGAGFGASVAGRVPESRRRLAVVLVPVVVGSIVFLLLWLSNRTLGQPFAVRATIAVVALTLAGGMMGMPFPLGIRLLPRAMADFIPWFWRLSGVASILGSALVVACVLEAGFRVDTLLPVLV